jgi:DNA-binding protein HU-beta
MLTADLVARMVTGAALLRRHATRVGDAFVRSIQDALMHADQVTLVGIGTFAVVARPSRPRRHPRTGREIRMPARKIPTFIIGKQRRAAVQAGAPKARDEGQAPRHVLVE